MKQFPSALPNEGEELEDLIQEHEQSFAPLKEKNEAKIIWTDKNKKYKTEYSIVYLHGFEASRREGNPWHRAVAQKFGCNLYLSRLYDHGLKRKRYLEDYNYEKYLASAVDACRVAQKIGKKVLVMGTSAGGALALYAAGSERCPVRVKGLMLASPLVHIYSYESILLETKLGRKLTTLFQGYDYKRKIVNHSEIEREIWYPYIPINAALELGRMVEKEITSSLFKNITCPVFVGYYNKNEQFHDQVVSPHAILTMVNQLATPPTKRKAVNFPEAGTHTIGSGLLSNAVPELIVQTVLFLKNTYSSDCRP